MDRIKTTQADCKWAWEQTAGSGAGTEWWLGEARSQQASDQTLRFNISNHSHCLEPQRGVLWNSSGLFPSLSRSVTDSYLHWLTLRELAARWEGGRQANWLCSSCLMAGYRRNGRPAARRCFSPQIDGKWWILSECLAATPEPRLVNSHFVFPINVWMLSHRHYHPGCAELSSRYKYYLHTPKGRN